MAELIRDSTCLPRVTRFEVIEEGTGRVYVRDHGSPAGPVEIEVQFQDKGRTLKVFVRPRKRVPERDHGSP